MNDSQPDGSGPINPIALVLSGRWTLVISPVRDPTVEKINSKEVRDCSPYLAREMIREGHVQVIEEQSTATGSVCRYATRRGRIRWFRTRHEHVRP